MVETLCQIAEVVIRLGQLPFPTSDTERLRGRRGAFAQGDRLAEESDRFFVGVIAQGVLA